MPKKKELIIISDIFDLVFHPQRGIAAINKKGRLAYAFFIVLITGLLHGTSVFLWGAATTPLAEHIKRYGLVYIPVITVILWLIFSLGLHLGGRILKTRLPYTKVLTMLGYIFSTSIIAFFVFLPAGLLVWIKTPIQIPTQIASFLSSLFLIYLAILAILGIKEIGRVSASRTVVILITGFVLYLVVFLGLGVIITTLALALFGRL